MLFTLFHEITIHDKFDKDIAKEYSVFNIVANVAYMYCIVVYMY